MASDHHRALKLQAQELQRDGPQLLFENLVSVEYLKSTMKCADLCLEPLPHSPESRLQSRCRSQLYIIHRNPDPSHKSAAMITDSQLYTLAIFLGTASMLLIVLYHFLEVNSEEHAAAVNPKPVGVKIKS